MATRKLFIDELSGKELASYLTKTGELYLEIKDEKGETTSSITLSKIDALLFILDLYRMRKEL